MSDVKCIYGTVIQDLAHMLDPEWCEEHCDIHKDKIKRYDANVMCFKHLIDMGIDPNNKRNLG